MDRRLLAEDRLEVGGGELVDVERAQALLQDKRPGERLLDRNLLIEREPDHERHRVRRDQRVGLVGVGEVETVRHGPIVPRGPRPRRVLRQSARFRAPASEAWQTNRKWASQKRRRPRYMAPSATSHEPKWQRSSSTGSI